MPLPMMAFLLYFHAGASTQATVVKGQQMLYSKEGIGLHLLPQDDSAFQRIVDIRR